MTDWTALTNEIKKESKEETEARKEADLKEIIRYGEEKKRRVMSFLGANPACKVDVIKSKFELVTDVVKDYGNGLVKAGFYADESYRVLCFELTMTFSDLKKLG